MSTKIEELKKQVDAMAKLQKGYELDSTILDSQLKSKKALMVLLDEEINQLKSDKLSIIETVKKEKSELIKAIDDRHADAMKKGTELSSQLSSARQEQNYAEEQKQRYVTAFAEMEITKAQLRRKLDKIGELKNVLEIGLQDLR